MFSTSKMFLCFSLSRYSFSFQNVSEFYHWHWWNLLIFFFNSDLIYTRHLKFQEISLGLVITQNFFSFMGKSCNPGFQKHFWLYLLCFYFRYLRLQCNLDYLRAKHSLLQWQIFEHFFLSPDRRMAGPIPPPF